MCNRIPPETIATIAALGFEVYQAPEPHWRSYLYYTDGTRIGYLQNNGWGLEVSTVHVPNRITGTGFRMTDDRDTVALTKEGLEVGFAVAPSWASGRDRESVRKWASWADFSKGQIGRLEKVA